MSLIGKLEQLSLSLVLQGIETYAKTGLLVVKQDAHWVELYFRDGRLMCIGPVRPNASLADRLLQAGVISPQTLQNTLMTIGSAQPGETRIALTLMDLGYVSHESLRAWAAKEASEMIQFLLTLQSGELYFEDGMQPPPDRLLVALSLATLLPHVAATPTQTNTQPQHVRIETTPPVVQQPPSTPVSTPPAQISASQLIAENPSIQMSASQLIAETPASSISFAPPEAREPAIKPLGNTDAQPATSLTPPQRVTVPLPPLRIDTSFMRPEMVLLPVDLSALRQQNPQLPITPEQWRILTRVDGQTTLLTMCRDLSMPSEYVCQLAGELIALGLAHVSMPVQNRAVNELSPVSQDMLTAGLGNGYVAPGYAASTAQPWMAVAPTTGTLSHSFSGSLPFETKSQWGNGGNGATFVPGRGWVATPQPMQPVQTEGHAYAAQNTLMYVGGRR
ncbi:MAG: DUF4388 domain-containing protein [Ktedonobacteraceae bacterium]